MWKVINGHVLPINDLKPHTRTAKCWCGPTEDENLLVHHSMDKRELVERGEIAKH